MTIPAPTKLHRWPDLSAYGLQLVVYVLPNGSRFLVLLNGDAAPVAAERLGFTRRPGLGEWTRKNLQMPFSHLRRVFPRVEIRDTPESAVVVRALPFPNQKFSVILADPPWEFETYSEKGWGKSPQKHYECMTDAEIAALPVKSIAAKDCALFLWVTFPKIFSVPAILDAWGFKYSGLGFGWPKYNPITKKFAFGGGFTSRKNLEPCLLALRGSPKIKSHGELDLLFEDGELQAPEDLLFAPRREHSRKPDEQYAKIERMYDGPYMEMFARKTQPGWSSWGNQVGLFDNEGEEAA